MRQQLLLLSKELIIPELYLILEADINGSYLWKRFRKPPKTQDFKYYSRYTIEEAVVNIYFAHLTQMCQSKVFTAGGSLVLCPKAFLDYMDNPKTTLEEVIKTADVVCLKPGAWQNWGKVLKWQACLAVWRKHGKKFEPMLIQAVEHLPPVYSETDQLPAYSEQDQPLAY